MNTQNRISKIVRTVILFVGVMTIWGSVSTHPAKANDCSCVDYIVQEVFAGHPKGTSEQFRGDPYRMAIKEDGSLARTNETSVYWNWDSPNDNYYHHPRFNAGQAQAGDVVIFLADQPLYTKDGNGAYRYTPVSGADFPGGHVAIVKRARYYSPQQDPTGEGVGGWEIVVRHANWTPCSVTTTTFFVPNGTSTSWWREY